MADQILAQPATRVRGPITDPNNTAALDLNLSGYPTNKHSKRAYNAVLGSAQATNRTLPGLLNTYYNSIGLNAPILAQSQLDVLKNFGKQFAEEQAAVDKIGQMAAAQRDLEVAQGPGKALTEEMLAQAKLVDPEYYAGRKTYSDKIEQLLGGINPNGLTEAEIANVERTQNRNNIGRGVSNSGSNISAVKNALTFDDRLQSKRNQLNSILTSFGGTLPTLKTGFNQTLATGKTGTGDGGFSQIAPGSQLGFAQGAAGGNSGLFGGIYQASKGAQTANESNPGWMKGLSAGTNLFGSLFPKGLGSF